MFRQRFRFPNERVYFGKHHGKTLIWIIDNDRPYFNYLINNGLIVTDLIMEYAKGNDLLNKKIRYKVCKSDDTLRIEEVFYYFLPKEKHVRKKDLTNIYSVKIIGTHKITAPYTIETIQMSRSWLGNGVQSDDIHCTSEWEEKVKRYDNDLLSLFINETLKNYTDKNIINSTV